LVAGPPCENSPTPRPPCRKRLACGAGNDIHRLRLPSFPLTGRT
jgi:hypothetical protein